MISPEYQEALKKSRSASDAYDIVRNKYRAGKIGDVEFLEARRNYEASGVEFDIAYHREVERQEAQDALEK